MKRLLYLSLVLLIAIGTSTCIQPKATLNEVSVMPDEANANHISENCIDVLRHLAMGNLRNWRGLNLHCSRNDAEMAFGETGNTADGIGSLANSPTAFRDYPATLFAPYGITVWYVQDTIAVIQVNSPVFPESPEQILGSPEGTTISKLQALSSQWIYASRGLTLHVNDGTKTVFRLYAYLPTTVDDFLHSPLSRVESRRIRLR